MVEPAEEHHQSSLLSSTNSDDSATLEEERWRLTRLMREHRDELAKFVRYTVPEFAIIDHPAFQRLFNVHQLGHTSLVYRGATHTRGSHALGTVAAAQILIDAISRTTQAKELEGYNSTLDDLQPRWEIGAELDETEVAFARLAALLHDIGHLPNGHTLEDELGLLPRHDSFHRISFVLNYTDWNCAPTYEINRQFEEIEYPIPTLSSLIDKEYQPLVTGLYSVLCQSQPCPQGTRTCTCTTPTNILLSLIARGYPHPLQLESQQSGGNKEFRLQVIRDLVGNTVCADLFDYLQRDFLNLGKPRVIDSRILQYMQIRSHKLPKNQVNKTSVDYKASQLVIDLEGDTPSTIRSDVVSGIIELLDNRYHLWEIAILHKTKTSASAMLERALSELALDTCFFPDNKGDHKTCDHADGKQRSSEDDDVRSNGSIDELLLTELLDVSDSELPKALEAFEWNRHRRPEQATATVDKSEDSNQRSPQEAAHQLLIRLRNRQLYKQIVRVGPLGKEGDTRRLAEGLSPTGDDQANIDGNKNQPVADNDPDQGNDKADRHREPSDSDRVVEGRLGLRAARRRVVALQQLELDFNLPLGTLAMYCAPWGLGKKIAKAQVFHDGKVHVLSELDAGDEVSGGYLRAQLKRFNRLWRASLFIAPAQKDIIEKRDLRNELALAFQIGVVGVRYEFVTMEMIAQLLAAKLHSPAYASKERILSRKAWERKHRSIAARGPGGEFDRVVSQFPVYLTSKRSTLRSWFDV